LLFLTLRLLFRKRMFGLNKILDFIRTLFFFLDIFDLVLIEKVNLLFLIIVLFVYHLLKMLRLII